MKLNSDLNVEAKAESSASVSASPSLILPRFRLELVGLMLALVLIPMLLLTGIAYGLLITNTQRQAVARLLTTSSYRQAQLEHWVDGLSINLYKLSIASPALSEALQNRSIGGSLLDATQKQFSSSLLSEGFDEVMLVSWDDRLLVSTNPARNTPPQRDCPAKSICSYEFVKEADRTRLIIQYPLLGDQGQQLGFIIGLADTGPLASTLSNRAGLENSGLAYLIGSDGGLRWLPGYDTLAQKQVLISSLDRSVLSAEPASYIGLLGLSVQGIVTALPRLNAWLIVEQPFSEIDQPIGMLPALALALIALTLAGLIAASRFLERRVQQPLVALAARAAQLDAALDNARDADQLKSRTIANMSHELRTPINSILNFSGFLLDDLFGALTPDQSELVRQMHVSSQHLLDLINDLLDMSKIQAGQMKLFVTEFDPAPVFDQAIATLRSLTLKKPITIRLDLPQTWPIVRGDRRRVLQILLNLVSNAAKFTDQGDITLRVHVYATRLEVRIEDSGTGVDPTDVPNLFEPYRQGYNALLLEKGGTGLGLPLSRIFARMHGGDLDYLPGEHGGALFILWIPLDAIAYEQQKIG